MQLNLGQRIHELRFRDGRTQEALAEAIGVTPQAVSRWEANSGYPDMEMIPSIANYFGITIDELFGYHNNRERRIDEIVDRQDGDDTKNGFTMMMKVLFSTIMISCLHQPLMENRKQNISENIF